MDQIFPPASALRIAVLADVDLHSVNKLAENLIPHTPQFDMVLLCGPLTHCECETAEELAAVKANIAAIVAQLETVVCRVAYLASDRDPTDVLTEQLHLTPNSVNIHARCLPLAPRLYTCGFAETRGNLQRRDIATITRDEDEVVEGLEVSSSVSSVQIVTELLGELARAAEEEAEEDWGWGRGRGRGSAGFAHEQTAAQTRGDVFTGSLQPRDAAGGTNSAATSAVETNPGRARAAALGIFCLCYKYSSTLNQFLFHIPEELQKAGVGVAIIAPPYGDMQAQHKPKLPEAFNGVRLVDCGSLRDGSYAVLSLALAKGEGGADGHGQDEWAVTGVEQKKI